MSALIKHYKTEVMKSCSILTICQRAEAGPLNSFIYKQFAFSRITTNSKNSFTLTERKQAITFHVKMQRLSRVLHKN